MGNDTLMSTKAATPTKSRSKVALFITGAVLFTSISMCVNGATTSYTYDSLNRVTKVDYGDGLVMNYTYDAAGNRLTETATAPEMVVEHPANTILVDGAASIDFGSVFTNSNADLVFTVKNTGNADLTGLTITMDGTGAAMFSVVANPTAPVAPSGNASFTLRFSPISVGAKTAALHIASNDRDENPFDITLTGTGSTTVPAHWPSAVRLFTVSEEDGAVSIPVTRTGGADGPVSVMISTSNGTATAGSDYTAVTNQLVTFATGDSATKNVPIPILNPANTDEINETFTVTLSSPTGGAKMGAQNTATVVIRDSMDTTPPGAPTITTPLANAKLPVNPGGTVTVVGAATDNQRVVSVEASLDNGASFTPAVVTPTGIGAAFGTTATYTVNVMPAIGGTNTVLVRTTDRQNNVSTLASRSFVVLRPLAVNIAGSGSVTAGFAPTSFREIGKSYTITATPTPAAPPGFAFNKWTVSGGPTQGDIGVTDGARELPGLTFVFRESLVLTANFIPNPFTAALTGAFNGLILPSVTLPAPGASVPSNETVGKVTAMVSGSGAFSGTLFIDGMSLGFAGVFDNTGIARFGTNRATTFTVVRTTKPSYELNLKLDLNPPDPNISNKMTGTLTQKIRGIIKTVSDLDADRAYYNGTTVKVPTSLAGASSKAYTIIFPAREDVNDQPAGFTKHDYPQGDGYATASVNVNGAVSVAGKLADGTPIAASAPLSKKTNTSNTWPLFQQLYPVVGVTKGCIAGQVTLDDTQPETEMAGTDLLWFRPFQLVQWYPYGWDEGIKVDLAGAQYVVPPATPATSVFPGSGDPASALKAVDPVNGNVGATLSDGLLSGGSITRSVNISPTNVATRPMSNTDASFTLTLTASSGIVTGTFTHTDGTKPAFQGIIIQKGTQRGAYGYFLTKQPAVIDYKGESGGVTLFGFQP